MYQDLQINNLSILSDIAIVVIKSSEKSLKRNQCFMFALAGWTKTDSCYNQYIFFQLPGYTRHTYLVNIFNIVNKNRFSCAKLKSAFTVIEKLWSVTGVY